MLARHRARGAPVLPETAPRSQWPPARRDSVRFDDIEDALDDLRNGRLVVVVDDADRENEGDLIGAAELVTPESVNFMAREARGLMCVAITAERAAALELSMMEPVNTGLHETPFTISVDLRAGTTTGISAADRAATIRALADETARPADFARPGHIFPLRAARGGVLRRAGHTEASVDLARLAGLKPAGVLIEIMSADGSMARTPELRAFADRHGLRLITIEALIAYRMRTESLVTKLIEVDLPTAHGRFRSPPMRRFSPATSTSRSRRARGRRTSPCSCGSTASASPATSSARRGATAATSSRRRWSASSARARASSCT